MFSSCFGMIDRNVVHFEIMEFLLLKEDLKNLDLMKVLDCLLMSMLM